MKSFNDRWPWSSFRQSTLTHWVEYEHVDLLEVEFPGAVPLDYDDVALDGAGIAHHADARERVSIHHAAETVEGC